MVGFVSISSGIAIHLLRFVGKISIHHYLLPGICCAPRVFSAAVGHFGPYLGHTGVQNDGTFKICLQNLHLFMVTISICPLTKPFGVIHWARHVSKYHMPNSEVMYVLSSIQSASCCFDNPFGRLTVHIHGSFNAVSPSFRGSFTFFIHN